MKITNLKIALGVAGLLGLGSAAHAQLPIVTGSSPETFEFTANAGQFNIFNGSTITIETFISIPDHFDKVITFDFVDTDLIGSPFSTGVIELNDVSAYGPTGWTGVFEFVTPAGGSAAGFTATEDSISEEPLLGIPEPDPRAVGTWVRVPDASGTFPLLLGVVAALIGVHHYNCPRPALARARR
jgi:hypothetical protein